MTQTHPITPPDELLEQWYAVGNLGNWHNALTLAYRAGADMEFEASYEWLLKHEIGPSSLTRLRNARRPKPLSLKERTAAAITNGDYRTALSLLSEALPND